MTWDWQKKQVISEILITPAVAGVPDANLPAQVGEAIKATAVTFQVNNAKLYASVVSNGWCSKWVSVSLQTKWLWILIPMLSFNFRYDACFEQGFLDFQANDLVQIHSETRTWHDNNVQSCSHYFYKWYQVLRKFKAKV